MAMKRFKLPVHKEWVATGDMRLEGGERAMQQLMSLSLRPSAVLTSNDLMAVGALQAAFHAGFGVPADVSIIGFDDLPIASMVVPQLTSIQLPRREIAAHAFSSLLASHARWHCGQIRSRPSQTDRAKVNRAGAPPLINEAKTRARELRPVAVALGTPSEPEGSADLCLSGVMLCTADLTESIGRHAAVWICKLGMVPRVEELSANREVHLPVNGEVFMHADIPVVDSRAGHAVEARGSEGRSCASGQFAIHEVHRVDGRVHIAGAGGFRLAYRLPLQPVVAIRAHVFVCQRIPAVAIRVRPESVQATTPCCSER